MKILIFVTSFLAHVSVACWGKTGIDEERLEQLEQFEDLYDTAIETIKKKDDSSDKAKSEYKRKEKEWEDRVDSLRKANIKLNEELNRSNENLINRNNEYLTEREDLERKIINETIRAENANQVMIQVLKTQQINIKYFSEVMNMMTQMNNRQVELIKRAQDTQIQAFTILREVTAVSERMQSTIETYGSNQLILIEIVKVGILILILIHL